MKKIGLMIGLIALTSGIWTLSEAQTDESLRMEAVALHHGITVQHYEEVYGPVRAAAKEQAGLGNLRGAADLYVRAAYLHPIPAIRAAMLRNAAFHLARVGDCERARDLWKKSRILLELCDAHPKKFPGYEKSRAKTLADIEWGLQESACKE